MESPTKDIQSWGEVKDGTGASNNAFLNDTEAKSAINKWVIGRPITLSVTDLVTLRDGIYELTSRMDHMDKQINKIKKDLDKGEKDTKKLLKMDIKQDKKMAACEKKMKKK